MSIESVSLIDAVYSARLVTAGLQPLANVQAAQTLEVPASDPYAIPSSTLTQLSGYGQLLSTASRTADGLQNLLGENSNLATSSNATAVTATATSAATAGSYSVTVNQTAQAQNLVSGYFTASDARVFSAGSFTIAVGGNSPVTVTIAENEGLIAAVGYEWGSLDNLAAAINDADAGVTASVENGAFGYQLKLAAQATGEDNTIALTANSDPFDGGAGNLALLAFTQSQAAKDAAFTIDGGAAQTSASNTDIALAEGASFSIAGTGTATITVASTAFVAADETSVTTAATKLVENYNALIGTAAQLIATGGALVGDTTTATPLAQALYDATQTGQGLTDLTGLGITGAGPTAGALSLNTTTLTTAFGIDAAGTAALLTSITNTLHGLISNYLGDSETAGTILSQARTTQYEMEFLDHQAGDAYPNLSDAIKQYVLQKSLASASMPTGLPEIAVFPPPA